MNIAIIGAGISGISLAYYLSQMKKEGMKLDISVFEQEAKPGGCIQSVERDGYRVESGPNGVLNSKEHFRKLYIDAGLADTLMYSSDAANKRYLQMNHKIYAAPSGPISALTTPLLSFAGKMRILKERKVPARTDGADESVLDFAVRRIGQEAADKLVATLVGGIYAGDASKLSVKAAFPALYSLEQKYGGLIKGMFGKMKDAKKDPNYKKKEKSEHSRSTLISSAEGMHGLVLALASRCESVDFHYNTSVEKIEKVGDKYKVQGMEFDKLAICTNAFDAIRLCSSLDSQLADAFSKVQFAPVFICGMGFDRKDIAHPLDAFGYLVMPQDKSMVLGTLFSSSLFRGRAPEGKALITSITVGDRNRSYISKSDEELKALAFEQVKDVLGIKAKPEMTLTYRYEKALPQYYIGYSEIVDTINERTKALGNLYIGGNTTSGVSVSDCVLLSRDLADKIKA